MKYLFPIVLFFTAASSTQAQNIDSALAEPQTIELTMSTPQPRMNETFTISIDGNHIRANIFRSLAGKVKLSNKVGQTETAVIAMTVTAVNKGKNEIGPLSFTLNGTHYTTEKIRYEVIDALPNTDKGLWFRKVNISDDVFCIIIEQRIPANTKTTTEGNKISFSTEAVTMDYVKFKDSYSIEGLQGYKSVANTNFESITDSHGKEKEFLFAFSVYYFRIENKEIPIKITGDKFEHLPAGHSFSDIIVQKGGRSTM